MSRSSEDKLTSMDSGVDTGNDSNDSSNAQHENTGMLGYPLHPSSPANANPGPTNDGPSNHSTILPIKSCKSGLWFRRLKDKGIESSGLSLSCKMSRVYTEKKGVKINERKRHAISFNPHAISRVANCIIKLNLAAALNNTEMMTKFLNDGISPNVKDIRGRTPLHIASSRGYTDMVRLLLQYGADPNRQDCIGNTPLHLAAVASNISVVALLLRAGADVKSLNRQGFDPLRIATNQLRFLQKDGGSIDLQGHRKELRSIVDMLLTFVQKQRSMTHDALNQADTLINLCSQLSLSNTPNQVQDNVRDLLSSIDSLTLTG